MAQYIDKDAALAEIENRIRACGNCYILDELASLHRTFDSLEVKEVDLEKDVRQIIDLYLEAGKYYDDVIRKERNMYGYSDLAIKLLDRTADANEMSIQYVLDKLKAQKGE